MAASEQYASTSSKIYVHAGKVKKMERKKAPSTPCGIEGAIFHLKNKTEQIIGTQDKPQCLVVQRLLSHLQYLVCTKSSTMDLSPATVNLGVVRCSRVLSTRH